MDIDQAATFLTSTILMGIGFAIIGVVIVFLNNIFNKYWKPIQWFLPEALRMPPPRFIEPHELPTDQQQK